jgi:hypothetical protein
LRVGTADGANLDDLVIGMGAEAGHESCGGDNCGEGFEDISALDGVLVGSDQCQIRVKGQRRVMRAANWTVNGLIGPARREISRTHMGMPRCRRPGKRRIAMRLLAAAGAWHSCFNRAAA